MPYKNQIKAKFDMLPSHIRREVDDYMEFLLQKYAKNKGKIKKEKFIFNWEGGLSKFKKRYTSVELQHKALEWR